MAWQKGRSGNPGGRPKAGLDVQTLARRHTTEAIAVLVEIMNDKNAPPTARCGSAQAILDRAWGRPAQIISGDPDGAPIRVDIDDDELARRIAMILARAGKGKRHADGK